MESGKYRSCTIAFVIFTLPLSLTCQSIFSQTTTPPNFKIAFIGDQGLGPDAQAVLKMIEDERADAVLHSGDFDYQDDPQAWDAQINATLGANFPYFACVGNHEDSLFYVPNGYQDVMEARMQRLGLTWEGDLGVRSSFYYNGIFFVLTGPDIFDNNGYDLYIRDRLAQDRSLWRISSWHKLMRLMQVGGGANNTGWGVYEESRKGGAIIATAHAHTYSRTHLLGSMMHQTIASTSDTLVLTKDDITTGADDEGKSFAFVSGLGGRSFHRQQLSGTWWASIYTSTQGANYGALFGIFNLDGVPNLAKFYFKDIDGVVPDSFYVVSELESFPVPVELASFGARVERSTVNLAWETASETNNYGFEIERAFGTFGAFSRIGFISGGGTTTSLQYYAFEDRNLRAGRYRYRLRQIDTDGSFGYSEVLNIKISPPEVAYLSQNYPNPFNPSTKIRYDIAKSMKVCLKIHSLSGEEVVTLVDAYHEPGSYEVIWHRNLHRQELASGVYFYRLTGEDFTIVKKMILLQ